MGYELIPLNLKCAWLDEVIDLTGISSDIVIIDLTVDAGDGTSDVEVVDDDRDKDTEFIEGSDSEVEIIEL